MNSYEKYMQEQEHQEFFEKKQKKSKVYYLQRKLREKDIAYAGKRKIVFPTPEQANDIHVIKLQKQHKFSVQTIIE